MTLSSYNIIFFWYYFLISTVTSIRKIYIVIINDKNPLTRFHRANIHWKMLQLPLNFSLEKYEGRPPAYFWINFIWFHISLVERESSSIIKSRKKKILPVATFCHWLNQNFLARSDIILSILNLFYIYIYIHTI